MYQICLFTKCNGCLVLILDYKVRRRDGIHERKIDENCVSDIFVGSH